MASARKRYPLAVRNELEALFERALDRNGFDPEDLGALVGDVVLAASSVIDNPPDGWTCDLPDRHFDAGHQLHEGLMKWMRRKEDVDAKQIVYRVELLMPVAWRRSTASR